MRKNNEVRFARMVPDEMIRRRNACPVAYLPVGALEWHGSHMPFGTDYMTVEHIAVRTAKETGGVVFPPLMYGDVRHNLHDSRPEWKYEYSRIMGLPVSTTQSFPYGEDSKTTVRDEKKVRNSLPFTVNEQECVFVNLIAYVMLEIYLYGFKTIILLPGHGPTTGSCQNAEKVYLENTKRRKAFRPPALTKTFIYFKSAEDIEPRLKKHWIHADKWEGSVIKAVEPKTVHLEKLPKDKERIPYAYLGMPYIDPRKGMTRKTGYSKQYKDLWENFDALDPRNINAGYGKRHIDYAVKCLKNEVREIMKKLRRR